MPPMHADGWLTDARISYDTVAASYPIEDGTPTAGADPADLGDRYFSPPRDVVEMFRLPPNAHLALEEDLTHCMS